MEADRVMTLDVTCFDEDAPISVVWDVMTRQKVRHVPVIDQGKLVGIISDRDLLLRATKALNGQLVFPDLCAAEVMTFHPVTCSCDASVPELAATMLEHRIDSVPITNSRGELVGLVTSADLLRLLAERVEVNPRPFCFNVQPGAVRPVM